MDPVVFPGASGPMRVFDLEQPRTADMPVMPSHRPGYSYFLYRRHEDTYAPEAGPRSSASGVIVCMEHSGTHIDAFCHQAENLMLAGGIPAREVQNANGFSRLGIEEVPPIIGRGVLLDVPRALGVEYFDTGDVVTLDELREAERATGTDVRPGDVLIVRWGREPRRVAKRGFDGFSGLHPECLPWLHEREIAVLGSDGISDPMPFVGTPEWPFPVHQIGITGMGLVLIDNMALERLAAACAQEARWEFLFTMAPLRIPRGTGCPVNPVAIL